MVKHADQSPARAINPAYRANPQRRTRGQKTEQTPLQQAADPVVLQDDAPGDLSPVLNPDTAEGEPCSSFGQISTCYFDKRQGHPAALFSEHRRQIRVRVMAFR